jgi:hypothetical protein
MLKRESMPRRRRIHVSYEEEDTHLYVEAGEHAEEEEDTCVI